MTPPPHPKRGSVTFCPKFQNAGRPSGAAEGGDVLRSNQRLQEADDEGGRRPRPRLLDLFLWLRHVAPQALKGDGCLFSIQSEDRRRTGGGHLQGQRCPTRR